MLKYKKSLFLPMLVVLSLIVTLGAQSLFFTSTVSDSGKMKFISEHKSDLDVITEQNREFISNIPDFKFGDDGGIEAAGVTWTSSPGGWWDTDWEYRINVTVTEPNVLDRTDWPVDVFVVFDPPAFKYSIRVIKVDGASYQEIPYQPWNITYFNDTHIKSATITFLVTIPKGSSAKYQIYWSTKYKDIPSYPKRVTLTKRTDVGVTYVISSITKNWIVEIPYSNGGKVMNITLPNGEKIGHDWTQFGVVRNASFDYGGYKGDADTDNISYNNRYIEEELDPVTNAFMGVIFITYVVEGVPLYKYDPGITVAYVDYSIRFYDFGFYAKERVHDWGSSFTDSSYLLGGWVFDQDDGSLSTFDYIYTPSMLVNMSKSEYPKMYSSITESWDIHKVFDTATNLPLIQVFRVYLTAGTHDVVIWTTGNDYYSSSWASDDPYGRVMDPNGNWLILTDTGTVDNVIDGGYSIWHDGGGRGGGVDFQFTGTVDGYYYIVVGVLDDDNGDGDMDFRVEVDGNTIGYGKLYTGHIYDENNLIFYIPRSAVSLQDFYPASDLVNLEHKLTLDWSPTSHDLDLILFDQDGSVVGVGVSGTYQESITFTPPAQKHYTVLVARFSGTGSSSATISVEGLAGAEYEDYSVNLGTSYDNLAFFHSVESRGIGLVKDSFSYTGVTVTNQELIAYNEGNDSDIDYIFWGYNVTLSGVVATSEVNYTYYVLIWEPTGSTYTERVSEFNTYYNCIKNLLDTVKSNIEKFKITVRISVYDGDGLPISGAEVDVFNGSQLIRTSFTNGSGKVDIEVVRYSYSIVVTVNGFGGLKYSLSTNVDYSTTNYVIHYTTETFNFVNIVKVLFKAVTNTTPEATISNGTLYLSNSSGSWSQATNGTGVIETYITKGSWTLEFNAKITSPDTNDTMRIVNLTDGSTLADGVTSYSLSLSRGGKFKIVDKDITGIVATELELYNTPLSFSIYWGEKITIQTKFLRQDTNELIAGTVYLYVYNESNNLIFSDANTTSSGYSTFEIDTYAVPINVGTYTIIINGTPSQSGFYNPATLTLSLTVNNRPSNIDASISPSTIVYWRTTISISVTYTDFESNKISGATITGEIIGDGFSLTLTFNEISPGSGIYSNTTPTENIPVGTYTLVLRAHKQNYETVEKTFIITIKPRETDLNIISDLDIYWSTSYQLEVEFVDTLLYPNEHISSANVTYVIRDPGTGQIISSGSLTESTNKYIATIDLSTISEGSYSLTIYAGKKYYVNQTVTATLIINIRDTSALASTTKVKVIYGEYISVKITFIDEVSNSYITNAEKYSYIITSVEEGGVTITGNLINYNNGSYQLYFNSSQLELGTFIGTITLSLNHYESQTITVTIVVEPIPTIAVSDKMSVELEYKDNVSFIVEFNRTDKNNGISNPSNYTYKVFKGGTLVLSGSLTYLGNGEWKLAFNTTLLNEPGYYTIYIFLEKPYFVNQTLVISLTVNEIATFAYSDKDSVSVIWGSETNITIFYNRSRDNSGIGGADLTIVVNSTEGQVTTLNYVVVEAGVYRISLNTTLRVGAYIIIIDIEKTHYVAQRVIVSLEIQPIPTVLTSSQYNATIHWNESLMLEISFKATYPGGLEESVSGANVEYYYLDAHGNRVGSKVTTLTNTEGKVFIDFTANEAFPPGAYDLVISVSKEHYLNKSIIVKITILERPLSLSLSAEELRLVWGDIETFSLQIKDSLTGEPINDAIASLSTTLNGSITQSNYTNGKITYTVDTTKLSTTIENGLQIFITVSRTHYTTLTMAFWIYVDPISLEARVIGPSSVTLNPVSPGATKYRIGVFDASREGKPVNDADVKLVVSTGAQAIDIKATPIEEEPGYYEVTVNWASLPIFTPGQTYSIDVRIDNLQISGKSVPLKVLSVRTKGTVEAHVDYLGGSTNVPGMGYVPNMFFYPAIIGIVALSTIVAYRVINYLRLPPEVKEIDKLIKALEKGILDYEAPLREEVIREIIEEELT